MEAQLLWPNWPPNGWALRRSKAAARLAEVGAHTIILYNSSTHTPPRPKNIPLLRGAVEIISHARRDRMEHPLLPKSPPPIQQNIGRCCISMHGEQALAAAPLNQNMREGDASHHTRKRTLGAQMKISDLNTCRRSPSDVTVPLGDMARHHRPSPALSNRRVTSGLNNLDIVLLL